MADLPFQMKLLDQFELRSLPVIQQKQMCNIDIQKGICPSLSRKFAEFLFEVQIGMETINQECLPRFDFYSDPREFSPIALGFSMPTLRIKDRIQAARQG